MDVRLDIHKAAHAMSEQDLCCPNPPPVCAGYNNVITSQADHGCLNMALLAIVFKPYSTVYDVCI